MSKEELQKQADKRKRIRERMVEQTKDNLAAAGKPSETIINRRGAEITIKVPYVDGGPL